MMVKVRKATPEDRKGWADFVLRSNNGTIFHLPAFLDYHPEGRFRNEHLVAEDPDGSICAVMPCALAVRDGVTWLRSYPGASYGGPVLEDGASLSFVESLMDAILDYCRENGFGMVEMTLPPSVYFRRPHDYIDFALANRGFSYSKRELTAVIDLRRLGEEIDLAFRESVRRGVRKAVKSGLTVVEDRDFSRFYPVLAGNLKDRHGVNPTHTLEELYRLEKLLGPEKIRQFVSVDGTGEVFAGMVMFHANPRVTLAFYISHNEKHQARRPVNLVYREVIEWARHMGYSHLDLGTFTLNGEVNHGLCRFKESFTARGQFRNTLVGKV